MSDFKYFKDAILERIKFLRKIILDYDLEWSKCADEDTDQDLDRINSEISELNAALNHMNEFSERHLRLDGDVRLPAVSDLLLRVVQEMRGRMRSIEQQQQQDMGNFENFKNEIIQCINFLFDECDDRLKEVREERGELLYIRDQMGQFSERYPLLVGGVSLPGTGDILTRAREMLASIESIELQQLQQRLERLSEQERLQEQGLLQERQQELQQALQLNQQSIEEVESYHRLQEVIRMLWDTQEILKTWQPLAQEQQGAYIENFVDLLKDLQNRLSAQQEPGLDWQDSLLFETLDRNLDLLISGEQEWSLAEFLRDLEDMKYVLQRKRSGLELQLPTKSLMDLQKQWSDIKERLGNLSTALQALQSGELESLESESGQEEDSYVEFADDKNNQDRDKDGGSGTGGGGNENDVEALSDRTTSIIGEKNQENYFLSL